MLHNIILFWKINKKFKPTKEQSVNLNVLDLSPLTKTHLKIKIKMIENDTEEVSRLVKNQRQRLNYCFKVSVKFKTTGQAETHKVFYVRHRSHAY